MSFICNLPDDWSLVRPVIRGSGSKWLSTLHVGNNVDDTRSYSIVMGFEPQPGTDRAEYFFCISVWDNETNAHDRDFWSGQDTLRLFDHAVRSRIKIALGVSLRALLNRYRPHDVMFITHDEDLPPKALIKFAFIIDIYREFGYAARPYDSYKGKSMWELSLGPL